MRKAAKTPRVFEDRGSLFWIITSTVFVGLLGFVDYLTGNEFSFSLFYLIPISLTSWFAKRPAQIYTSSLSAVTWLAADVFAGEARSHPMIYFWNTLIRFGFFIIVTYLISELHKTQKEIRALAHMDYISGVINSRYFHELVEAELRRSNRYKRPFTLVYIDLDNFKLVNDRFGHEEGDKLIRLVADELKKQLRNTDIVARLGGDEFAILFPEAGQEEARSIISKLHKHFMARMSPKYPFVTISAGAVTYIAPPTSAAQTIKIADELMYSVKNSTKNGIQYSLFTG